MSRAAHKLLAASGAVDDYEIDQSLRFNYSNQSYLSRVPNATGNRRTYTLSFWAKICKEQNSYIFAAGKLADAGIDSFQHSGGWQDNYYGQNYSPQYYRTSTTYQKGRDPATWYHIFHVRDTTQSTAGDRVRTWINGVEFDQLTTEVHNSFAYHDQNEEGLINTQVLHRIGGADDNSQYMDGNLAEYHFFDGAVKSVTDFGKTNPLTGQWVPKKYGGGGYGTNGFYLKFSVGTQKFAPWFSSSVEGVYVGHTAAIDSLAAKSFTQEGWIYPEADGSSSLNCIWSCGASQQIYWDPSNERVAAYYHDGSSYIFDGVVSTGNVKAGQWCHFAVVRNGNDMTVYTHGVGGTSASNSGTISASTDFGYIGSYKGEAAAQFKGSVYGFRSTIGTARYTSNFTPPTSDLTDDIAWDGTAKTGVGFLQVTNSNNTITDAGEGHTMTKVGSWSSVAFSPTVDSMGTDHSGQKNDWVPFNLLNDGVSKDTPTNNFATWNALDTGPGSVTWGSLRLQTTNHNDTAGTFMFPSTGKWYFEIYCTTAGAFYQGIAPIRYTGNVGNWDTSNLAIRADNGSKYSYYSGGWQTDSYGSAFSNGDILQCAVDMDNGKIWWGDSGTWIASGNPATGSNQAFTFTTSLGWKPFIYGPGSPNAIDVIANFGQNGTFNGTITAAGNTDGNGYGDFKYAVPSGFKALCSKNFPDPTIAKPEEHFSTVLWTGTGAVDHDITGVGFQPDLVWIKARSQAYNHAINDSVRGAGLFIEPSTTMVESYNAGQYFGPFASDGYRLNDEDVGTQINQSSQTYVGWNWKAGTAFSNDASATSIGTIDSSGSANADAGFSIVKFTMPSSGQATVKHGLSVKPKLIISKDLDNTYNWAVFHEDTVASTSEFWRLNTDDGLVTYSTIWGAALPTSSVFGVTAGGLAAASAEVIAYCFAEVEGYSKFGTYEANASTNGPYVHTGFTPAWIVFKYIDGSGEWWWMLDSTRDTENLTTEVLYTNANNTESTISSSGGVDFLSNGFKIRATNGGINNANTYMYMAFAKAPFKYSNGQ